MKVFYFLSFLFITTFAYSQIKFDPGYIVDNEGNRLDCLIKNKEWLANPDEFEYMITQDIFKLGTTENIKEFGVSYLKYERHQVEIDKNGDNDSKSTIEYQTKTLFLKVLLEGHATLYFYQEGNLQRYFFKVGNGSVKQLDYKRIITEDEIKEITRYKNQLQAEVQCANTSIKNIEYTKYTKKDLVSYFLKYNSCFDQEIKNLVDNPLVNKGKTNLYVKGGINHSELELLYSTSRIPIKSNSLKFGVEFENILPFNKNQWGLVAGIYYSSLKDEERTTYSYKEVCVPSGCFYETTIDINSNHYSYLEIPIGLRKYFYLTDKSKIFLTGTYSMNLPIKDSIQIFGGDFKVQPWGNAVFGLGFMQNNRFLIELNYQYSTTILSDYNNLASAYSSTFLLLGYNLVASKK